MDRIVGYQGREILALGQMRSEDIPKPQKVNFGLTASFIGLVNISEFELFVSETGSNDIPQDAMKVNPYCSISCPISSTGSITVWIRGINTDEKAQLIVFYGNEPVNINTSQFSPSDVDQNVKVSGGALSVDNFPDIQKTTVQNFPDVQDVEVTNFPATQTVHVDNVPDTQKVTVQNFADTQTVQLVKFKQVGVGVPLIGAVQVNGTVSTIESLAQNRFNMLNLEVPQFDIELLELTNIAVTFPSNLAGSFILVSVPNDVGSGLTPFSFRIDATKVGNYPVKYTPVNLTVLQFRFFDANGQQLNPPIDPLKKPDVVVTYRR